MKSFLKNHYKLVSALGFGMMAFVMVLVGFRTEIAQAIGYRYQIVGSTATTTTTFAKASAGAFSTTTVATDGVQQVSFLVMLGSSTTPPVLNWRVQFSDNGVDWYDQDALTTTDVATSTYHVASGAVHVWNYSSTTANQSITTGTNSVKFITKKIVVQNLDTAYTRVVWLNQAGGDVLLNVLPIIKNEYVFPK